MSALRLPEAAQEQHNLETSANPATCWSERGSICPPTVRFNLFAFISTEGRWITGKRVLSHFQPPTRHCYTEHGTRHMAKEYSFCKPLFPYKYILFAINIMIFLKKYTVYWYFLFFFCYSCVTVYLLHNWWLLMTFSKWGKLLMIFKFIFIRVNELP